MMKWWHFGHTWILTATWLVGEGIQPQGDNCSYLLVRIFGLYVVPSIHPLFVTAYPIQGRGGGGLEPIPADIGRRRGTPWTGRQTITGLTHRDRQPFTLTFTPTGNLESTINLTCMSLDCGRKSENTGGEHKHRRVWTYDPLAVRRQC